MQGKESLCPSQANLNGRVGWDSNLILFSQRDAISEIEKQPQDQQVQPSANLDTVFLCPSCNYPQSSKSAAFQLQDLDKTHKCKQCSSTSSVQKWLCMCHSPWHMCMKHSVHASKASDPSSGLSSARPQLKRTVGPFNLADLQAYDAKRRRKLPPRILPPAPNLLSSKLKQRFAHLFEQ